jgi:hypothetical protein
MPSSVRHVRRRLLIPKRRKQASVVPPAGYHLIPFRLGITDALVLGADVVMLSTAVPPPVPVMFTGLVVPKLNLGVS